MGGLPICVGVKFAIAPVPTGGGGAGKDPPGGIGLGPFAIGGGRGRGPEALGGLPGAPGGSPCGGGGGGACGGGGKGLGGAPGAVVPSAGGAGGGLFASGGFTLKYNCNCWVIDQQIQISKHRTKNYILKKSLDMHGNTGSYIYRQHGK